MSIVKMKKKTVQVVKELCKPFGGSFRTIFIDRFYTSMDLLKAMDKMQLYVTGTVMSNGFQSRYE